MCSQCRSKVIVKVKGGIKDRCVPIPPPPPSLSGSFHTPPPLFLPPFLTVPHSSLSFRPPPFLLPLLPPLPFLPLWCLLIRLSLDRPSLSSGTECGLPEQATVREVNVYHKSDQFQGLVVTIASGLSDSVDSPVFEVFLTPISHARSFETQKISTKRVLSLEVVLRGRGVGCRELDGGWGVQGGGGGE